jgi:hypothetical protein
MTQKNGPWPRSAQRKRRSNSRDSKPAPRGRMPGDTIDEASLPEDVLVTHSDTVDPHDG